MRHPAPQPPGMREGFSENRVEHDEPPRMKCMRRASADGTEPRCHLNAQG